MKIIRILFVLSLFLGNAFAAGPVITGIAVSSVTANSATITWTTDSGATSQVLYGVGSLSKSTTTDGSLVASHSVKITNLLQSTIYSYAVVSQTGADSTQSATQTFSLCNPGATNAGNTLVTGQVNAVYGSASYIATWVDDSGVSTSSPTVCGSSFATTVNGSLSTSASLSANLPDVNMIIPSPSHWNIAVKSVSGTGQAFSVNSSPTGSSADISGALQATAVITPNFYMATQFPVYNIAVTRIDSPNLSTGDHDLFTVPSGKVGMASISIYNTSNGNISATAEIKSGGVYYQVNNAISLTTLTHNAQFSYGLVLAAGNTFALNTITNNGLNVFLTVWTWDDSSPVTPLFVLMNSGDNNVLTCPSGKHCLVVGNDGTGPFFSSSFATIALSNQTGSTALYHYNLVPSGLTAATSNQSTGSISINNNAASSLGNWWVLGPGDFLNVNSNQSGKQVVYGAIAVF